MTVDETARPMRIPPEYGTYAEEKQIFDLLKLMLEDVILNKPADPLKHMIQWLGQDIREVPTVLIQGKYGSGRHSVGKLVAKQLKCPLLLPETLTDDDASELGDQARAARDQNQPIPDDVMVGLIKNRVAGPDAKKKGWVLVGFPETRQQAQMLQTNAILASHFVSLQVPDEVVMERSKGKKIDPETGDIYHITFDYPSEFEVEKRLISPAHCEDDQFIVEQLTNFHRNDSGLQEAYSACYSEINADQPKADVVLQVMNVVTRKARSAAPHTPRIIIMGARGAGKSVQSALIAKKYNIVNVKLEELIKTHVANESNLGLTLKPFVEENKDIPDNLVFKLLEERLSQLDCVSKGWVLNGFPRNGSQAERLDRFGYKANRVFLLDIPTDTVIERVCQRSMDPLTGTMYHMVYNPPPSMDVKDRLQVHPRDREETVQGDLNEFHANKEEVMDYYESCDNPVQVVNADQDTHTVFETLESLIVNPPTTKA